MFSIFVFSLFLIVHTTLRSKIALTPFHLSIFLGGLALIVFLGSYHIEEHISRLQQFTGDGSIANRFLGSLKTVSLVLDSFTFLGFGMGTENHFIQRQIECLDCNRFYHIPLASFTFWSSALANGGLLNFALLVIWFLIVWDKRFHWYILGLVIISLSRGNIYSLEFFFLHSLVHCFIKRTEHVSKN